MFDFEATAAGDLYLDETGEIHTTESVAQAVYIRLRWFLAEWRLGPSLGFPYWEYVLVKNPNLARIRSEVRKAIMDVDEVTAVDEVKINFDQASRIAVISVVFRVGEDVYRQEVNLDG